MTLPISTVSEDKQESVRKKLCEVVAQEKEKFLQLAQAFYDDGKRTEKQCIELTSAIITTVDNMLAAGDWDSSLFLRNTIKPLRELREQALHAQSELLRGQGLEEIGERSLEENEIKVYVSLYQAEGHDMQKWEGQIRSIHAYMAGRPIYKSEEEVKTVIRQKLLQISEAYAVAVIDKSKILANEFSMKKVDRQGFELMTIELGALSFANVIEFVHLGRRYSFYNQRLVLKNK